MKVTLTELSKRMKDAAKDLKPMLMKELAAQGLRTRNHIVRCTPVDAGLLRASNRVEVNEEGSKIKLEYFNNQIYAAVQHEEMSFNHTIGMAKYVEIPFLESLDRTMNAILKAAMESVRGKQGGVTNG